MLMGRLENRFIRERQDRLRRMPGVLLALALVAWCAVGCRAETRAPSVREEFRRLLTTGRAAAPLNPQPLSKNEVGNNRVERVRFTPEAGQDAIALIYRPKAEGRYPTVIVQHFLGGTKDSFYIAPLLNRLAERGYLAVAIDGRYRGERQNGKPLEAAMLESLRTGKGHPWLLDTTYDVLRLLDYLETRGDVDAKRIGMTGISEGGVITWMAAAADERIRVAAPIIGVTSFADTLAGAQGPETAARLKMLEPFLKEYAKDLGEPGVTPKVLKTAWEKLFPGGLDRFDAPSLLPEIAPRPLLIVNHEQDELFSIAGARRAHEAARARYRELKAEDRLEFHVAPGLKHSDFMGVLDAATRTVAWLDRWLKAPPS